MEMESNRSIPFRTAGIISSSTLISNCDGLSVRSLLIYKLIINHVNRIFEKNSSKLGSLRFTYTYVLTCSENVIFRYFRTHSKHIGVEN